MAGFEQGLEPDPLVDTHGPGIHSVDPRSPQYDTDYERGWQASQEYDGDENSPTFRAPLEEMDDSNASHAAYDGYFDYAAGRPKWAHRAWRRLGEPGQGPDDGLPDEHWAAPHKVASTQHESTHGPREKEDMRSVLDVQGSPGNWDYDPYMHGMFNGMELMRSIADGDDPEFRDAPDQYREERATWRDAKPGETPGSVEPDDAPAQDPRLVRAGSHPLFTTVNEHLPIWPGENHVERMTALAMLKKQGETDEEFWARMEREHPGQQNQSPYMQSPDAAGQSFEEYEPSHTDHPDDWSDTDWDDMIPERMSLREHAHMLRSPGFQWDGDMRYPKYQKVVHREVVDADGHRGHGMEGHVIEHNTHNRGPVLPEEDYEPGPLEYPWTHTYYPAGLRDEEGLVKGYNTAQQATDASHQLALWGARHPKSQEMLHSGYRYVGSEMPYDPSEKLPHEIAQETPR